MTASTVRSGVHLLKQSAGPCNHGHYTNSGVRFCTIRKGTLMSRKGSAYACVRNSTRWSYRERNVWMNGTNIEVNESERYVRENLTKWVYKFCNFEKSHFSLDMVTFWGLREWSSPKRQSNNSRTSERIRLSENMAAVQKILWTTFRSQRFEKHVRLWLKHARGTPWLLHLVISFAGFESASSLL